MNSAVKTIARAADAPIEVAHGSVTKRTELPAKIARSRLLPTPKSFLRISWPRRASNVLAEISDDKICAFLPPIGLVDARVCRADATFAGLKLSVRRTER